MKKFLAIMLGAIFVLSFAASAFAIHAEIPSETQAVVARGATQITIDGEIRSRGWYQKNIDYLPGDINPLTSGANGLPFDSKSEAWYDQRIRLSVDAKVSPNVEGYIQLESGVGNQNDLVTWGNFNSKLGSMTILQAWLMYSGQGLFGFPSGLKIGHMPLALGEKQFFDHTKFGDDAIVFFMNPTKELEIDLLTIKFLENNRFDNQDDLDGYVGIVTYKWDPKNTVGLNYTYLHNGNEDPTGLGLAGKKESDLGLHAAGNISGLSYKAQADFQFGDKAEHVKAKGYGLMAGLGFMVDPINIRVSGVYGSGPDDHGTNPEKAFDTFLGNDQHYTLVYEYRVVGACGMVNQGICNTTYGNIGVDFTATKDLKASIDGYYLRASKSNEALGFMSDSKDLGWEADAKIVYNVAKNLTYQVDAGYFKTGSFYGEGHKNATVLRHAITLSF